MMARQRHKACTFKGFSIRLGKFSTMLIEFSYS